MQRTSVLFTPFPLMVISYKLQYNITTTLTLTKSRYRIFPSTQGSPMLSFDSYIHLSPTVTLLFTPGNCNLVTISVIFLFQERYINGMIQYVTFWKTAKLLSRMTITFYFLTRNAWVIQFLHIISSIWCGLYFFYIRHSDRCVVISQEVSICVSLMANDVEHVMCLLAIRISSLGKCLFMSFAHFLVSLFFFPGELENSFVVQILVLCWICVLQIFFLNILLVFSSPCRIFC